MAPCWPALALLLAMLLAAAGIRALRGPGAEGFAASVDYGKLYRGCSQSSPAESNSDCRGLIGLCFSRKDGAACENLFRTADYLQGNSGTGATALTRDVYARLASTGRPHVAFDVLARVGRSLANLGQFKHWRRYTR